MSSNSFLSRIKWRNVSLLLAALLLFPIIVFFIFRSLVAFEIVDNLPSKRELRKISNPLASEIYSKEGKLFGRYYVENRTTINPEDLNNHFKNALVSTEDHRFYKHNGIDFRSLGRVLVKTILLQKDNSGGGSTITQQLAKNLFPRRKYRMLSTVLNKFREMEVAKRLEKVYSKDEILMLYANTVSYGERAFGIGTASERFFNKPPSELELHEAATLVGILKATSYYSPRLNPERATQRRNVVISQMEIFGNLDAEVADYAKGLPLGLDYQAPSEIVELARYFKREVKLEFDKWAEANPKSDGSLYDIYRDGLRIYSTVDYDLQIAGEAFMKRHMADLQRRFLDSWKGGNLYGNGNKIIDEKILSDPHYKRRKAKGLSSKEALDAFTSKENRRIWTWNGMQTENITKIDSIKHYLSLLHAGVMAADPNTGEIKVWIGGNDYGRFQYDNIKGTRQVGSTFKPIVYLTALDRGGDPCKMYENELRTYTDYKNWTPKNADDKYGGLASMKGALTHSINTVSVQVLFEAGANAVGEMARKLGISSPLSLVPSMVLGTNDVSLEEMVSVYSKFANEGKAVDFHCIERIEDVDGNVLYERKRPTLFNKQIVDPVAVRKLNDMMQNVTLNGTGRRIYSMFDIDASIKGKTGTTQNQSDGWFMGYNDNLVVGAWVGTMDRRIHFRNLGTGSGGRTALPLAGAIFELAEADNLLEIPEGEIVVRTECPDTISHAAYAELQRKHDVDDILNDLPDRIIDIILKNQKKKYEPPKRPKSGKRVIDKNNRLKDYKKAIQDWETEIEKLVRPSKKRR